MFHALMFKKRHLHFTNIMIFSQLHELTPVGENIGLDKRKTRECPTNRGFYKH